MNLLTAGELCGCDIQYVLKSSQSNVSRHLTYLKNSGIVSDRRDGYRVYYRLVRKPQNEALFSFLAQAFGKDRTFSADVKALTGAIKDGECTISGAADANGPSQPKTSPSIRSGRRTRSCDLQRG